MRDRGRRVNIDFGLIIEEVCSSDSKRIYAVRKALRIFEEELGMKVEDAVSAMIYGEIDVYDALRRFLATIRKENLAPKTIRFYLSLLIRILRMAGVEVRSDVLRYRVSLPASRILRVDRAPTIEELRKILTVMGPRNRALFLMLASTGMRLSECLQLRLGDLDLDARPPYLLIRSAKTGDVRKVYLTRECVEILKAYLGKRLSQDPSTSWIWPRRGNKSKYLRKEHAQQYWYSAIRRVGLDQRDSSGLGYQLHIHSLRKFYRTQLERAGVSRTVISLWMGQRTGLDLNYFRPSEPQLIEEWRKAEPFLTIFEARGVEELKKDIALETLRRVAESFGIDPMRVKIEKQKELGREPSIDEEIQALQNEMKKLRNIEDDPKRIVDEEELEGYLERGWDVQAILPSGRIIIKKTSHIYI